MIRAHLRRWRPRPHAQRTGSTPRVRPSGAALQLDPSHRSSQSRFSDRLLAPRGPRRRRVLGTGLRAIGGCRGLALAPGWLHLRPARRKTVGRLARQRAGGRGRRLGARGRAGRLGRTRRAKALRARAGRLRACRRWAGRLRCPWHGGLRRKPTGALGLRCCRARGLGRLRCSGLGGGGLTLRFRGRWMRLRWRRGRGRRWWRTGTWDLRCRREPRGRLRCRGCHSRGLTLGLRGSRLSHGRRGTVRVPLATPRGVGFRRGRHRRAIDRRTLGRALAEGWTRRDQSGLSFRRWDEAWRRGDGRRGMGLALLAWN